MRGILGRKLGMSQIFDQETGVMTPVTVIEAGPCPVVAVRTPDADGYEAVQLAWEPVADRKISKAERGHRRPCRGSSRRASPAGRRSARPGPPRGRGAA